MDASNLFPTPVGLMATLRRHATRWPSTSDQGPVADDQVNDGLAIEPDDLELNEARGAKEHAEERLAQHRCDNTQMFVWERRPYLLASGLGALLIGLSFGMAPESGSSPMAAAMLGGALAVAADRFGRDLRLAWYACKTGRVAAWFRLAGTGAIAFGLAAGGSLMLAGQAPIWTLLLIGTWFALAIAGWRRQDPDPERQRLEEAALEAEAKVEALRSGRQQELETARAKLDHLLADLAEA